MITYKVKFGVYDKLCMQCPPGHKDIGCECFQLQSAFLLRTSAQAPVCCNPLHNPCMQLMTGSKLCPHIQLEWCLPAF